MSALRDLSELAEGTDVAVVQGERAQHWKVHEGGLIRDGMTVDAWFLSGLLAEGKITLGDFAPPTPGEWFTLGPRLFLVLEQEGILSHCATFRARPWSFIGFHDNFTNLVEHGKRRPAPEQVGPGEAFFAMTELAWKHSKKAAKADRVGRVSDYLRYIKQYAEQAEGLIT